MTTEATNPVTTEESAIQTGAFVQSLQRNNSKIRSDRAQAIAEDAELIYKRAVEDMQVDIKKLRLEQNGLLDLSPSTADSLIPAAGFDSRSFVSTDLELGLKIRNLQIRLDIAIERYELLFGKNLK